MTARHLPGSSLDAAALSAAVTPGSAGAAGCDAAHSRFVQRVRRRYPAELGCLAPGMPRRAAMEDALQALTRLGHPRTSALRVLRQLVLERLAVLDCEQMAPLADVTLAVTELAELALDQACELAFADLDALHGAPLMADGQRAQLWVIGMGKLGARELNVSSDIDLIFAYDEDGETDGARERAGVRARATPKARPPQPDGTTAPSPATVTASSYPVTGRPAGRGARSSATSLRSSARLPGQSWFSRNSRAAAVKPWAALPWRAPRRPRNFWIARA